MEKNKIMMIAIIVLLLALLGTIVGVGFYVVNSMNAPKEGEQNNPVVTEVLPVGEDKIKTYTIADAITTNLLESPDGSKHVVKLTVGIGVNMTEEKVGTAFYATLAEKDVVINDIVATLLRKKTFEEMSRLDAIDILKEEVLQALQDAFQNNLIVRVYFGSPYLY